jgi:lysophospholipase L1-like esterase
MLLLQLQQGNIPDVVVFYDGYNDTYAPNSGARAGYPEDNDKLALRNAGWVGTLTEVVKSLNITRLLIALTGVRAKPVEIDVPTFSQEIVHAYLNVYRMTGALANEYGFSRQFFWQPQLLTENKPLTPFEQKIHRDHPWNSETVRQLTLATYDLMAREVPSRSELFDITNAFEGVSDPIYFDPCHVLPAGNRKVVEAMTAAGLEETVRAQLAKRQSN